MYENQYLLQQRQVDLLPGSNVVRFEDLISEGSQFEVEIQAPQDTFAENNFGYAVAQIRGQPHVLLVDPNESRLEPLAGVLRANDSRLKPELLRGYQSRLTTWISSTWSCSATYLL
jgi:hypothetical protein